MMDKAAAVASIDIQRRAMTTFRVEAIPSGTNAADLLLYFDDNDRKNIMVHSLATLANSDDGTEDLVATISFATYDGSIRPPYLLDVNSDLSIDREFHGFTPLNNLHHSPIADIVAITGIGCHAFDSWAASPQKMWLRDHLPYDIPQVRVLLYGCHTNFTAPYGTLVEQAEGFVRRLMNLPRPDQFQKGAQRPLILIGHDVGCLVIKKAIEIGAVSALTDVPCVVFFGAPHGGLSLNELALLVGSKPSPITVEELGPHPGTLRDLDIKFGSLITQTSVIACEIQKKVSGLQPADSSTTTWVPQLHLYCRADRSSIGKVRKTEAGPYWPIIHEITQSLHSWASSRAQRSQTNRHSTATSGTERSSNSMAVGDTSSISSLPELPGSHVDTTTGIPKNVHTLQSVQTEEKRDVAVTSCLRPSDLFSSKTAMLTRHTSPESGGISSIEPSPDVGAQGRSIQSIPMHRKVTSGMSPGSSTNSTAQSPQRGYFETWILPYPAVELAADESSSSRHSCTTVSTSPTMSPRATFKIPQSSDRLEQSPALIEHIEDSAVSAPIPLEQITEAAQESVMMLETSEEQALCIEYIPIPREIGSKNVDNRPITRRPTLGRVLSRFRPRRSSSSTGDMFAASLFTFVKQNDIQEVEALITSGIDVNVKSNDDNGNSAIHYAAAAGHAKLVTVLMKRGARVGSKNNSKRTPLHDAAARGHISAITTLIEANADVNATDTDDNTPLHLAALGGHLEAVKLLVRNKANCRATRVDGRTALQLSINKSHSHVSKYLERAGQQDNTVQWPGLI